MGPQTTTYLISSRGGRSRRLFFSSGVLKDHRVSNVDVAPSDAKTCRRPHEQINGVCPMFVVSDTLQERANEGTQTCSPDFLHSMYKPSTRTACLEREGCSTKRVARRFVKYLGSTIRHNMTETIASTENVVISALQLICCSHAISNFSLALHTVYENVLKTIRFRVLHSPWMYKNVPEAFRGVGEVFVLCRYHVSCGCE